MTIGPIMHLDDARAWRGEIPIESLYTVGIAGERFFREIKDNARIMGTACEVCGLIYVPARLYCQRCLAELMDWVDVGTLGEVYAATVMHVDLDGSRLEEPEVVAFVHLDGTDGGLVHRLGEIDVDQVEVGLAVEAVFKPAEDREGSILDIRYFRPI